MAAQLHLAENTLALHLLFERLQRLVDVVVTDENLHLAAYSPLQGAPPTGTRARLPTRRGLRKAAAIARATALAKPFRAPHLVVMAIRKIARMGHPVLLARAEPVADPADPEIRRLIADMIETMQDAHGAGLAAPQVHVPLRLFVFRVPVPRASGVSGDEAMGTQVLINPQLTPLGDDIAAAFEGCLSLPGLQGLVARPARIRYTGIDPEGRAIEREAGGFHARVVQHEADHLDGVLYPMRMTDFARFGFNEELAREYAS